jgi:hypothetical protein
MLASLPPGLSHVRNLGGTVNREAYYLMLASIAVTMQLKHGLGTSLVVVIIMVDDTIYEPYWTVLRVPPGEGLESLARVSWFRTLPKKPKKNILSICESCKNSLSILG